MSERIHFSPLGSSDARRIGRLQKKLFPRELAESEDEIRQILLNTEKHLVCNLSYGVFDGTRMVGYVFAYVETRSIFHDRDEEVVYIKEIALERGYEAELRPLFQKLFAQWVAFTPHLPVEAHAQADALANWQRLNRLFRFYGLTLTSRAESGKEGRPPYQLLRLDVAATTAGMIDRPMALPKERFAFSSDITVSVVRESRQWLALKEQWNELLRRTPDSNVFQSFDYLWEWWKYFGIWNELHIMVIRRGDEVLGVAPFMLEHFSIYGRAVRKLLFITAPMEMSRPKLLFGENETACLPALLAYLETAAATWDIIDIDEQLHSETSASLREHFRKRHLVAESATVCPYIDVKGSWEQFLQGRSRKMRSNIGRIRKRLAASGDISIRTEKYWPALDAALDVHCEIEERSWKADRQLGIASDKAHYFFYKGLAKVFGRDESFVLRILECDGKPLASTFGILREGMFQSMKIAHDQQYDNLSPGTALESYELEDLFRQGLSRYEFMGSFLANKLRWTATVHTTTNIHVYQRQPRLILFYFLYFVAKRWARRLLQKTGQLDHVGEMLGKLKNNPLPRY